LAYPSNNNIIYIGGVELSDSGLLDVEGRISHWVLVTGVSENNQWFRILNPLHNQIEYYSYAELEEIRNNSGQNIIVVTNQSF
jgi:hypothetical protein